MNTSTLPTSTVDLAFETLLGRIVTGVYPALARLPAERELAEELTCARSSLREALRRLDEWGLIDPRRGSGIVVRPSREWSMHALPAYLRLAAPLRGPEHVGRLVRDLLQVRRTILLDVLETILPRLRPDALGEARAAAQRAWEARERGAEFVREDFQILRSLAASAEFWPGLWILNSFSEVYFQLAEAIPSHGYIPASYLERYEAFFAAIACRDAAQASAVLGAYMDEHDRNLLTHMGIEP